MTKFSLRMAGLWREILSWDLLNANQECNHFATTFWRPEQWLTSHIMSYVPLPWVSKATDNHWSPDKASRPEAMRPSLKGRSTSTRLYGAVSRKAKIFIHAAVRTLNLTYFTTAFFKILVALYSLARVQNSPWGRPRLSTAIFPTLLQQWPWYCTITMNRVVATKTLDIIVTWSKNSFGILISSKENI
jgi:hypothetical protein